MGHVHLYCSIMASNHQKQKEIAKQNKMELTYPSRLIDFN